MSVLVIRTHKRFAVCQRVPLRKGQACVGDGLLIELSLGGCRVSQVEEERFSEGDEVSFQVEGFGQIDGEVRWSGHSCVGLRLTQPLHQFELENLLEILRGNPGEAVAVGQR